MGSDSPLHALESRVVQLESKMKAMALRSKKEIVWMKLMEDWILQTFNFDLRLQVELKLLQSEDDTGSINNNNSRTPSSSSSSFTPPPPPPYPHHHQNNPPHSNNRRPGPYSQTHSQPHQPPRSSINHPVRHISPGVSITAIPSSSRNSVHHLKRPMVSSNVTSSSNMIVRRVAKRGRPYYPSSTSRPQMSSTPIIVSTRTLPQHHQRQQQGHGQNSGGSKNKDKDKGKPPEVIVLDDDEEEDKKHIVTSNVTGTGGTPTPPPPPLSGASSGSSLSLSSTSGGGPTTTTVPAPTTSSNTMCSSSSSSSTPIMDALTRMQVPSSIHNATTSGNANNPSPPATVVSSTCCSAPNTGESDPLGGIGNIPSILDPFNSSSMAASSSTQFQHDGGSSSSGRLRMPYQDDMMDSFLEFVDGENSNSPEGGGGNSGGGGVDSSFHPNSILHMGKPNGYGFTTTTHNDSDKDPIHQDLNLITKFHFPFPIAAPPNPEAQSQAAANGYLSRMDGYLQFNVHKIIADYDSQLYSDLLSQYPLPTFEPSTKDKQRINHVVCDFLRQVYGDRVPSTILEAMGEAVHLMYPVIPKEFWVKRAPNRGLTGYIPNRLANLRRMYREHAKAIEQNPSLLLTQN